MLPSFPLVPGIPWSPLGPCNPWRPWSPLKPCFDFTTENTFVKVCSSANLTWISKFFESLDKVCRYTLFGWLLLTRAIFWGDWLLRILNLNSFFPIDEDAVGVNCVIALPSLL